MKFQHLFVFGLVCSLMLLSCKKGNETVVQNQDTVKLDSLSAQYYDKYLEFYPLEATSQGDERFNDQLPNSISDDFIAKEIAFYNRIQKSLSDIDYQSLPDDKKTVYDVLDFTLKDKIERYAYHPEYIPFTQFSGLPLDFPLLGSGEGSQPFKTEKDYENWLKRMEQFPAWMDQAIINFKNGIDHGVVLPKKLVIKMIPQMLSEEIITKNFQNNLFYGPIKRMPQTISADKRKEFEERYQTAIEKNIIPAYEKMGAFLSKEYLPKARNTDGYNAMKDGDNIYRYFVKSWTTSNLSPMEIKKLGDEQVAMLRAEMEKVKQQVGFKGSLEEFLTFVKSDLKAMPYKDAKQVIDAFNGILKTIDPKLKTMFSNVPKTAFEIRQTEKFREATASAEYIQGSADGSRPGIFYIPLPDPSKFNVTSGMESLFLHEAIPGHHYQISLQQENMTIPKFMRFGWFGAYGEGWAHYCETLGPELGLYTDPYQKMGYLSDQMLRAVRLVIDTGLHTGTMTREEAIKYFLRNVAYDEAGATAEVERYMAMPGQALSYKVGAINIRDLRTKYTQKLGERFNLASFHDEVLNQGCLPLSVLDRKMENWAEKQ